VKHNASITASFLAVYVCQSEVSLAGFDIVWQWVDQNWAFQY
jgi:hypothetical protein